MAAVAIDWLLAQGSAKAPAVHLEPLRRVGLNVFAGDVQWKYRCVTAFRAPELHAKGEIQWLEDYEGAMQELGHNCFRDFNMWANTGYSAKAPKFYEHLEAHWLRRKAKGRYTHSVLLCDQVDGSSVRLTPQEQQDYVKRCTDIARRVGTVILECVNEDFKNGQISHSFPEAWFQGLIATRSTWQDDQPPATPAPPGPGSYLSLVTKHTDRGDDFAVKGKVLFEAQRQGLGSYPAAGLPAISGEPRRIAEGTNPRQHADDAAVCELFGLGSCTHGGFSSFDSDHESDLQNCKMPSVGSLALRCIQARSDVWKSELIAKMASSNGEYTRGGFTNCPIEHHDEWSRRSYFMLMGDKAYGLAVDPNEHWKLNVVNGWHLVAQGGYRGDGRNGNVLVLAR